jgi:hypothetical protein
MGLAISVSEAKSPMSIMLDVNSQNGGKYNA